MKRSTLVVCLLFLLSAPVIFAQGAAGTITGTVADPTGAVVAGADIEISNTATGQLFKTVSTDTGAYTVAQLPVGPYQVGATASGFKTYKRAGLALSAAQIMRIDIALEVGSQAESITVSADASLLKTESGDMTHNVTSQQLATLPILSTGGTFSNNTSGWRDPLALARLMPGVQYGANSQFVVNGTPNSVFGTKSLQIRIEGQTSGGQGFLAGYTSMGQASVDAIQEVAVETSNYAAEFGAAGAVVNATMKSGTNNLHGSVYDYAANEALNAFQPYTGIRSPTKRHDYGVTVGGPLWIPKIYDGRNKTFLFFSFEEFREDVKVSTIPAASGGTPTVPIDAYRNGNFAQVITGNGNAAGPLPFLIGGTQYMDPLGRSYNSGTIFDPTTVQTITCPASINGRAPNCNAGSQYFVRNAYVNNTIPASQFDPVALRILNLVPKPVGPSAASGQVGSNYQYPFLSKTRSKIPSVKGDQNIGTKHHVSFYGQGTLMDAPYTATNGNAEGLPAPITGARASFIYTKTYRANWDYTIRPTLLLHFGAGWFQQEFNDDAPATTSYNAALPQSCTNTPSFDGLLDKTCTGGLGLTGARINRQFPRFVVGSAGLGTGGMNSIGPFTQGPSKERRPSGVVTLSWVRGNHNYKVGGEWRQERYPATAYTGATGQYTFASNSTIQTALDGVAGTTTGVFGFPFASFLRGDVTNFFIAQPGSVTLRKSQSALFIQDTWKLTRKFTFDYGLRWDYATYGREENGLTANFSPTTPNPSANGHPGAQIFEKTCNCKFARNYPYAIGPRLGFAYQINTKTVFRGGFGIISSAAPPPAGGVSANTDTTGTVGFGQWVGQLQNGIPSTLNPVFPNLAPNAGQGLGAVVGSPAFLDPNSTKPARQYQWSLSLQREINRNLVLEASYVANRGVWWPANGLAAANVTSVDLLSKYGFQVGNTADAGLLTRQLQLLTGAERSILQARGVNLPYPNFPVNQTVRQSLLPFPQYNNAINPTNAPLGKTWYDSLQLNLTQRFSHGLTFNANYTFSKNLDLMSSPDIFNRKLGKNLSGNDLPHQLRISAQYQTPRLRRDGFLGNPVVSAIFSDWSMGLYMQYQSAPILGRPASTSSFPISQYLGRGPGSAQLKLDANGKPMSPWAVNWTDRDGKVHPEPIDINCHCFDPTKTAVLNPLAWTNVPDGQWANDFSAIRYYRGFRYPSENLNFGLTFRIKEGITFNVRLEMTNVFNRTQLPQPNATATFGSQITTQTVAGLYRGAINGGFGSVVPILGTANSRTGLIVGRLTF